MVRLSMRKNLLPTLCFVFFALCLFTAIPASVFGQSPGALQEGIRQYEKDRLEEAVDLFLQARREAPQSSEAAFWLGMAYKQQNRFQDALPHLRDAIRLTPHVREAAVELIDTLYRLNELEEAEQWIAIAERDNILPAKTTFLKGMVLAKERKYAEAIGAFEKAKELDKSYSQSADFQIGLSYMLDRKYKQASERFRVAVQQDSVSDLASFARTYQDLVEERSWIERPVRLALSLIGQYDTNMLQEPYIYHGLGEAGEQSGFSMLNTLRVDVVPTLPGNWLFNAGLAVSSSIHDVNTNTHDLFANSLSIAPGYNFGRFAVNLSANYTWIVKRSPSYARYSDSLSVGPLVRYMLTEEQDQILEVFAGYRRMDSFQPPIDPNEDPRGNGLDTYVSWMKLFKEGGILNLKYGFATDNTDGSNGVNSSHRLSVNGIIPFTPKLKLQLGAEVSLRDYQNANTISVFEGAKRKDVIYTGIAGITWDIHRNLSLLVQYTGTRAYSNLFLYDYDRSVYSIGAEIRF